MFKAFNSVIRRELGGFFQHQLDHSAGLELIPLALKSLVSNDSLSSSLIPVPSSASARLTYRTTVGLRAVITLT